MKTKPIITALLLAFIALSIFAAISRTNKTVTPKNALAAPATADLDAPVPGRQVSAIYFLTDVRCPSCFKIETWSHQAILDGFGEELKSGLVKWDMINYEDMGNEHYIQDYGLITKSVVLVEHIQGKEMRFINLPEVWNLLGDQEKFAQYITDELHAFIDPPAKTKAHSGDEN